jgi:peroxiredoxin
MTDANLPPIGEPAPDFLLAASVGGNISLDAYRGEQHVLLAFYGLDFTGG